MQILTPCSYFNQFYSGIGLVLLLVVMAAVIDFRKRKR